MAKENGESLSNALAPSNWYRLTRTGMVFLRQPSQEEWLAFGEGVLYTMERALRWWWGDYLNMGEQSWGEMYSQALDESGYKYQTLANAASVARKIPRVMIDPETGVVIPLRSEDVSFSAHAVLAKFSEGEGDLDGHKVVAQWLEFAAENRLSERKLRILTRALPTPSLEPENEEQRMALEEVGLLKPALPSPEAVPEGPGEPQVDDHGISVIQPQVEIEQADGVEMLRAAIAEAEELKAENGDLKREVEHHQWRISDLLTFRRAMWAGAWCRERRRRRDAERRVADLEARIVNLEDQLEGSAKSDDLPF